MTENLPARTKRRLTQTRKSLKMEKAVTLRSRGATWDEVAEELGYASGRNVANAVHDYIARLAKSSTATVESYRQEMVDQLDQLAKEAWDVLKKHHVAHSGGRVVQMLGEDGEVVTLTDDGPTLNAIDRLLKIMERKARLTGVDLTPDTAVGVQVNYTIEGVNPDDLR